MITYVDGDLFQSPAQVLVNTVNTVGVMGKGIALQFKKYYPDMFEKYQVLCENGQLEIGKLWLYKTPHKWILNFPTKKDWRQKSSPQYIEAGLQKFVSTYASKGITSISFPRLGCGNGELDWETQVRPLMEQYLQPLPITVFVHRYKNELIPEHRDVRKIRAWLHGEPQALSFVEFVADLEEIVGSRTNFVTQEASTRFSVSYNPSSEAWLFKPENDIEFIVYNEQLLELWQYVRTSGYCMLADFPVGLNDHAHYLAALLSQLPYINPVMLTRPGQDRHSRLGLQIILPVNSEMPLFSNTSAANVVVEQ